MKISLITVCKNESILMPFFIRHYENIVDEIHLFDNMSTDNTRELASKCPKIKIHTFDTGGMLRDDTHAQIKNMYYRILKTDWVITVDFDEFIYNKDLRGLLEKYQREGITFPKITGYNMIGTEIPKDDGVTPITKLLNQGVQSEKYSKRAVFQKQVIINYGMGCHDCNPRGNLIENENAEILLLHYKWLSKDYITRKYTSWVLSPQNIAHGWGVDDAEHGSVYYDIVLLKRKVIPELL